jgi:leader peptidase (prepilin peptidase)/N-methyltransferase
VRPLQWFSFTNDGNSRSTIAVLAIGAVLSLLGFFLLPLGQAILGLILTAALTVLSVIDFRERLLPDILTLPLLVLGLAIALAGFGPSALSSASGAAIGWAGLGLLAYFYRRFRGFEGVGLGDAKLLGALGAWCGIFMIPVIVFMAASLGLTFYALTRIAKRRLNSRDELPFGPFLALAGWCAFVATRTQIEFLKSLFFVT